MVSGLVIIETLPERSVRDEFITHVDPYVAEAFEKVLGLERFTLFQNYSRSFYSREEHIKSILKYDKEVRSPPDDPVWHKIVSESYDEFLTYGSVQSLSALTDFKLVKYHSGTSAGFGYVDSSQLQPTHKGPTDGNNYKRAIRIASKIVHVISEEHKSGSFQNFLKSVPDNSTPDVAFTRTQLAELPFTKVRNVFGEAFHYVILEGLFARPLIERFMRNDTFYYIGADPVIDVPRLITRMLDKASIFYTFDWSAFDASVQVYEIELAFDLLKRMLRFPDEETAALFEYVKTLFISRKLLGPDGTVYLRTGGIPSGSYFTHIVGSIINWVRIRYLMARHGIDIVDIKTHGDDGLVTSTTYIPTLQHLSETAEYYAWYLKAEKSRATIDFTQVEFLGRYIRHGMNYRLRDRILRLSLYPEYPVNDPQISLARLKSIYYDSGSYSQELVKSIRYLTLRYGDQQIDLPRQFRRFDILDYATPEGV